MWQAIIVTCIPRLSVGDDTPASFPLLLSLFNVDVSMCSLVMRALMTISMVQTATIKVGNDIDINHVSQLYFGKSTLVSDFVVKHTIVLFPGNCLHEAIDRRLRC